ncbi:hypothetical protein [Albidovulum sp.]|uniref:hypothetical protein n=1 Tax=Albidovulum sp. TaxID=1872424 RepID=UPI0039B96640
MTAAHNHGGKPAPQPSVRETATKVDRVLAALEHRQAERQRTIGIVRALASMTRRADT